MLSPRQHLLVINLYEELGSYRAVADVVGCDHKTVKAHLERERQGEKRRARRATLADPYLDMIRAKLEVTNGRITAKALFRLVVTAGFQGSRRTLRRTVAELKAEWRKQQPRRIYRPWQSAPGDVLIIDWAHVGTVMTTAGPRPLSAFCAVLGWSRYRFVHFTTSQRFAALASGLAACFEHLGGVTARVMFDNPKTVTTVFVAGQSVFNPELVRLAAHYPFSPDHRRGSGPRVEREGRSPGPLRRVRSGPRRRLLLARRGEPSRGDVDVRGERRDPPGDRRRPR